MPHEMRLGKAVQEQQRRPVAVGQVVHALDDPRFEAQRAEVFNVLETLPAYDLAYGHDPAMATKAFPELLRRHASR